LNPNFFLAQRNRYSEGTDNAQKTPRGHPDFYSYVQNLHVFIFQTDRRTDKQTNRLRKTLAARGLEELFFPVVLLCQFLVLAGNRFWFYTLIYLKYNTVVVLC
jgi:hypothetical protein